MMPELANPKHEKFCRLVASGKTLVDAYVLSGFSEKSAHSGSFNLSKRSDIMKRISEVKAELEGLVSSADEEFEEDCPPENRQYVTTSLTVFWVVNMMKKIAEGAYEDSDWAAAQRATEVLGKELGLFLTKPEKGQLTKGDRPASIKENPQLVIENVNIGALDGAMKKLGQTLDVPAEPAERTEEPKELVVKDSNDRRRIVRDPAELEEAGHRFYDGREGVEADRDVTRQRRRGTPLQIGLPDDPDHT